MLRRSLFEESHLSFSNQQPSTTLCRLASNPTNPSPPQGVTTFTNTTSKKTKKTKKKKTNDDKEEVQQQQQQREVVPVVDGKRRRKSRVKSIRVRGSVRKQIPDSVENVSLVLKRQRGIRRKRRRDGVAVLSKVHQVSRRGYV